MRLCKAGIVLVVLASSAGAVAQEADDQCVVDVLLKDNYLVANQRSQQVIENSLQHRDLNEEACLPAWESLSGQLRNSIPSFSDIGSSLATRIRNMVCKTADRMVTDLASQANVGYEAPFGLFSIEAGVGTDGRSGVTTERSTETQDILERTVTGSIDRAGRTTGRAITGSLDRNTSSITGVNRSHADEASRRLRESTQDMDNSLNEKARNALGNF